MNSQDAVRTQVCSENHNVYRYDACRKTSIGEESLKLSSSCSQKSKSEAKSKKRTFLEYSQENSLTTSPMECSPATFLHTNTEFTCTESSKKKIKFSKYEFDDTEHWREFMDFDLDESEVDDDSEPFFNSSWFPELQLNLVLSKEDLEEIGVKIV